MTGAFLKEGQDVITLLSPLCTVPRLEEGPYVHFPCPRLMMHMTALTMEHGRRHTVCQLGFGHKIR